MNGTEKRTRNVSSKVSHTTKLELERISRECKISSGDILTNYVLNKSNVNAHELLLKMNMLEERLDMIERLEKEQNKILNYLKEEHKYILGEIRKLEKIKPNDTLDAFGDSEENIKASVKIFFDIKKQHTNSFGLVDMTFDPYKVGKTLCGRYNADYDVFSKSVEMIDDGFDINEFLSSDLEELGVL